MRPAQFEKKANAGGLPQHSQAHACDAGRPLVGTHLNLLTRHGIRGRIVTSALAARISEVEPLFVVSGLVRQHEADGRWDNVNGTMAHEKPLCDSGRTTNPQYSGHFWPWGSPPRPHSGVTPEVGHGMLVWVNAASSGEIRVKNFFFFRR